MNSEIRFIYITTKDKDEARSIGRALLEARMVACVNVIDGVESMYWWEGKIQDDREALLIAKTIAANVPALMERVKELHSYDCPCILSFDVTEGNPAFFNWVGEEVSRDE